MKYLAWILRAIVFLILLIFAMKNDQPVTLRYFFGYEWHASLVLILLLFLSMGVVVGMLAMLSSMLRQRKEISSLKKELNQKIKIDTNN